MTRVRQLVVALALAYPVALLATMLILRFGGPHFWQAELALYLPRILFALPLPFLVPLLLIVRRPRWIWTQAAAALLVAFPLMGLVVTPWRSAPKDPSRTLRVLSYNGNFAHGTQEALVDQVRALKPDVAVFQQLFFTDRMTAAFASTYAERRTDGEFFIVSRFPIRSIQVPERVPLAGRRRSPRFIRYELETPVGPIVLYNVHPISPLFQLTAARTGGLRQAILTGALFSTRPRPEIDDDTSLRTLQVQAFARMAEAETLPVIIAGDTNLPNLSPALAALSAFRDGFRDAGRGFGYTFPARRPWMRIDRIFASRHLRFLDFEVGSSRASDHLCVVASLEPAASR